MNLGWIFVVYLILLVTVMNLWVRMIFRSIFLYESVRSLGDECFVDRVFCLLVVLISIERFVDLCKECRFFLW